LLILVFDVRRIPPRRAGACNTLKEPAGGLWGILNKASLPLPLLLPLFPVPAVAAQMLHPYVRYDAADSSAHAVASFVLHLKHPI